jgi:hypothetical protein
MMSSLELGHAAAYHAYRSSIRGRPLLGDIEMERENLIGLAVAEGGLTVLSLFFDVQSIILQRLG